jgi:hypothetical protein
MDKGPRPCRLPVQIDTRINIRQGPGCGPLQDPVVDRRYPVLEAWVVILDAGVVGLGIGKKPSSDGP